MGGSSRNIALTASSKSEKTDSTGDVKGKKVQDAVGGETREVQDAREENGRL